MLDLLEPTNDSSWIIHENGYDPLRERGIEARFAVGNGFLGVRGAPEICGQHVCVSWPRTYVAGLFDAPPTVPLIPGLVFAPEWTGITVEVNGEPILHHPRDMVAYERTLDMRRAALFAAWRPGDAVGAVRQIRTHRMVSHVDRGLGLQIVWIDFAEAAEITLDASSATADPLLEPIHLASEMGVWRTRRSGMGLAMATSTTVFLDGGVLAPDERDEHRSRWRWQAIPGQAMRLERFVSLARSESVVEDPGSVARAKLGGALRTGWRATVQRHEAAWDERWRCSDVQVDGDEAAQQALRFAAYHLNCAANPADESVSVGARALTGDDYRGHVFWDTEIFLLPFYTLTWPEAARALLSYRHRTLPAARAKAARMGWRGAFYAWESARGGEETTPDAVVGADGTVIQILSGREEEHVSADVAYAVWHYWRATGDDGFLLDAGAEILFETARFWASRDVLEADTLRHIRGVEGPDEYHEHIDDNAFTNVMARWNIRRGVEAAALLREQWPARWADLAGRLQLDAGELEDWATVADTLAIRLDKETGLFEQFTGFFKLDPIDLTQYVGRTTPMDVVLGRERTRRSQVIKQADVVALIALLPGDFDHDSKLANFRYYEPRCDHGSSLSRAMHAQVAARLGDAELALRYFREAAAIDLADTADRSAGGVHIATLGGLWQAALFGFAGLALLDDGIALDPRLPGAWRGLSFRVRWRSREISVRIEQNGEIVNVTLDKGKQLKIVVAGNGYDLGPGRPLRIEPRP